MWYFSWILGLAFACCFSILNAMWLELDFSYRRSTHQPKETPDENTPHGVPGRDNPS